MASRLSYQTPTQTIEEMNAAGIRQGVLCGGSLEDNLQIEKILDRHQDRFIGIAGCRPDKDGIIRSYIGIREAFKKKVFKGVSLSPYIMSIYANDRRLYPLYALCADARKVAIIHSSLHYNPLTPMDLGDPRFLDQIAVDFPDLRIVMSHSGVGFGAAMALAIAQRHDNVYLEVSALIPKYINPMFIQAYNSYLKKKVVFGTDYPLVPFSILEDWKKIIKKENWDKFFRLNALRLLSDG